jgi:hypothetical protein
MPGSEHRPVPAAPGETVNEHHPGDSAHLQGLIEKPHCHR